MRVRTRVVVLASAVHRAHNVAVQGRTTRQSGGRPHNSPRPHEDWAGRRRARPYPLLSTSAAWKSPFNGSHCCAPPRCFNGQSPTTCDGHLSRLLASNGSAQCLSAWLLNSTAAPSFESRNGASTTKGAGSSNALCSPPADNGQRVRMCQRTARAHPPPCGALHHNCDDTTHLH